MTDDSKSNIVISALSMLLLGAMIVAIGIWSFIGFLGAFEYESQQPRTRNNDQWNMSALWGGIALIGLSIGGYLIFCGMKTLARLLLAKGNSPTT